MNIMTIIFLLVITGCGSKAGLNNGPTKGAEAETDAIAALPVEYNGDNIFFLKSPLSIQHRLVSQQSFSNIKIEPVYETGEELKFDVELNKEGCDWPDVGLVYESDLEFYYVAGTVPPKSQGYSYHCDMIVTALVQGTDVASTKTLSLELKMEGNSSCQEILDAGYSFGPGVYTVDPDGRYGGQLPQAVYCNI